MAHQQECSFLDPILEVLESNGLDGLASALTVLLKEIMKLERARFLNGKRYLIHDRDPKFTEQLLRILKDSGVDNVKLPRRSPNLNAFAERFVLSIKSECLNKLILFRENSLRRACSEFARNYHDERNHQGLDNRLIEGAPSSGDGEVQCHRRLGGLLKFYDRAA